MADGGWRLFGDHGMRGMDEDIRPNTQLLHFTAGLDGGKWDTEMSWGEAAFIFIWEVLLSYFRLIQLFVFGAGNRKRTTGPLYHTPDLPHGRRASFLSHLSARFPCLGWGPRFLSYNTTKPTTRLSTARETPCNTHHHNHDVSQFSFLAFSNFACPQNIAHLQ